MLGRFRTIVSIALVALPALGCATLFNSGTKAVSFGSTPSEAEVWIDGALRGMTPISLDLDNHRSTTVTFRKDGYRDVSCALNAGVGVGWVILDVLGGLIPVIVDAATGAWKSLDSEVCNVVLPPAVSGDEHPAWRDNASHRSARPFDDARPTRGLAALHQARR